ncbi:MULTISPECIES: hypothetical protein [unclassified Mesorhizobium]|uniref:hypothetical protein n=1 Tax=unclassified Mesorhizobium TaxID=325217 RepID=UPI0033351839
MFELRFGPTPPSPPADAAPSVLDYLTLLAGLLGQMLWPLTIAFIAYLFRSQLQSLAVRLEEFSFPGGSAKFKQSLERLADTVQKAEPTGVEQPPAPLPDSSDPFLELAGKYPAAAVMEAYKEVESFLNEIYPRTSDRPRSLGQLVQLDGTIDSDTKGLFKQLLNTRNAAVHAGYHDITPGEALEFRELARITLARLRKIPPTRPIPKKKS